MEDVCVKAEVPFMVAKESVELAKGGVDALIGPSIFSILKVNLIELASVEGSPETIDEGTVDVALVLATSLPDLVEVAEHKPSPIGRKSFDIVVENLDPAEHATLQCVRKERNGSQKLGASS
jgi:hypothetical protein